MGMSVGEGVFGYGCGCTFALKKARLTVLFRMTQRDDYIVPAMQSNAVYESRYLMGTSLARPCIAKGAMQAAVDYGCGALAHGATGKGNDQVRFELSFYALAPRIKVVAPWINQEFLDKFQGRSDMLAYAQEKGIPIEGHGQAKPFSMDDVRAFSTLA